MGGGEGGSVWLLGGGWGSGGCMVGWCSVVWMVRRGEKEDCSS